MLITVTIQVEANSVDEAMAIVKGTDITTPVAAPANNTIPFPAQPAATPPAYSIPAQPQVVPTSAAPSPAPTYTTSAAPPMPVSPLPAAYVPPVNQPPAVPTQAPTYTQEDLMRAATPLLDNGRGSQLQQILAGMGAAHLGQLPVEQYGAFALELQKLGAKL